MDAEEEKQKKTPRKGCWIETASGTRETEENSKKGEEKGRIGEVF